MSKIQDIAIIGMSCKFPKADNIEEFWKNIKNGKECISFFSKKELKNSSIDKELLDDPSYVRARGVINNPEAFDAKFFNYTPAEAYSIDTQQKIFLECSWSALENAGYNPHEYTGNIGIFAGVGSKNTRNTNIKKHKIELQNIITDSKDFLCTRVAYKLDLKGPAITIQTACSTSLVAIHQACISLRAGECNMVLAGGVFLPELENGGYLYTPGSILSPDGKCRAFDKNAEGTVGGNGAGIVVLKLLKEAILDGDHIYAIIKGSAVNNDGSRKIGFTAPSSTQQKEVIKSAHINARVSADTISYIETHGTATPLGDMIEIEGLKGAFEGIDKKQFCAIGSVKTNIGHLDVASGVAGFIKSALCLYHKTLVPSLHFNEPNPILDLLNSPFCVNTELKSWQTDNLPRRAGVSSFGIGGTNVHMVLEEYIKFDTGKKQKKENQLLFLSACTKDALKNSALNLVNYLQYISPDSRLEDLSYTLLTGRKKFNYSIHFVASNIESIIAGLKNINIFNKEDNDTKEIVFVFSDQGLLNIDIYKKLYKEDFNFRSHVDKTLKALRECCVFNFNVEDLLETLEINKYKELLIFIFEYSVAKYLINLDIVPHSMIGYGIGEYVAACISGVFTVESAWILLQIKENLKHRSKNLTNSESYDYKYLINKIKLNAPTIKLVSNLTGKWLTDNQAQNLQYWIDLMNKKMLSFESIFNISSDLDNTLCLQIGENNQFSNFINSLEDKFENTLKLLSLLNMKDNKLNINAVLLNNLGKLFSIGIKINWNNYFKEYSVNRIPLPTYPFEDIKNTFLTDSNSAITKITSESKYLLNAIKDIWSDILGFKNINDDDSFYYIGGDSLTAIQLRSQIKEKFNINIDIKEIENTTIAKMSSLISDQMSQNGIHIHNDEYILEMQSGNFQKLLPLILIHPIGGEVNYYSDLLRTLSKDQPVYAIRSPMLNGDITYTSIEDMSKDYLQRLEKLGIIPPYVIAGASFGGVVAYHMAQLVNNYYSSTPTTILIDTPAYNNLPQVPTDDESLVQSMMSHYSRDNLSHNNYADNQTYINSLKEFLLSESGKYYIKTIRIHYNLMKKYVPFEYQGKVVFFQPKTSISSFPNNQNIYWLNITKHDFNSISVPGDHFSMNFSPNIKFLGRHIQEIITYASHKKLNKYSYESQ